MKFIITIFVSRINLIANECVDPKDTLIFPCIGDSDCVSSSAAFYCIILKRDIPELKRRLNEGTIEKPICIEGASEWPYIAPFGLALEWKDTELVHFFISHGAALYYKDDSTVQPLVVAIATGKISLVKL